MAQLDPDRHYGNIVQMVGAHPVAAIAAAVLVLIVALFGMLSARQNSFVVHAHAGSGELIEAGEVGDDQGAGSDAVHVPDTAEDTIKVDVTGAVASPGVVELEPDARVIDAIEAAGGQTAEADISSINRAAKLIDGEKVHVPRIGETPSDAAAVGGGEAEPASGGLVNINTAGLEELDELPGVGPSTAQAIIDEREQGGPFTSIEDIMRVSGIGEKKFEKLKTSIRI